MQRQKNNKKTAPKKIGLKAPNRQAAGAYSSDEEELEVSTADYLRQASERS